MIVNMIIREILESTVGYRDKDFYIPALFFADDGLLVANSQTPKAVYHGILAKTSSRYQVAEKLL